MDGTRLAADLDAEKKRRGFEARWKGAVADKRNLFLCICVSCLVWFANV